MGMRDKRMTHTCGSPHQRGCVLVQQRGVLGVHGEPERETERVDTRQKVCVDAATGMCACAVLDGQLEVSGIEARRAVVGS